MVSRFNQRQWVKLSVCDNQLLQPKTVYYNKLLSLIQLKGGKGLICSADPAATEKTSFGCQTMFSHYVAGGRKNSRRLKNIEFVMSKALEDQRTTVNWKHKKTPRINTHQNSGTLYTIIKEWMNDNRLNNRWSCTPSIHNLWRRHIIDDEAKRKEMKLNDFDSIANFMLITWMSLSVSSVEISWSSV